MSKKGEFALPPLPVTGFEGAWAAATAGFDKAIAESDDRYARGEQGDAAKMSGLEAWLPITALPMTPTCRADHHEFARWRTGEVCACGAERFGYGEPEKSVVPVIGPATNTALKHRAAVSAARVAAAKAWDQIPRGRRVEVDPLDVTYDDVTLRELVTLDADARHEGWAGTVQRRKFTLLQRAAVSAHWSEELSAKIAAKTAADKERERNVVTMDGEEW